MTIQAHVCLQSTLEWARFRRTRLGHRLITRIARRAAPRKIPGYDRHVEREAETRVKEDAPNRIDAMLEKVNEAVKIEQTLAALANLFKDQLKLKRIGDWDVVRLNVSAPELGTDLQY